MFKFLVEKTFFIDLGKKLSVEKLPAISRHMFCKIAIEMAIVRTRKIIAHKYR